MAGRSDSPAVASMLVKAHSPSFGQQETVALPASFAGLCDVLASSFELHPGSLRLRCKHESTGVYVILSSEVRNKQATHDRLHCARNANSSAFYERRTRP